MADMSVDEIAATDEIIRDLQDKTGEERANVVIDVIKKCLNEPKTVDALLYNRIIDTLVPILKEQADDYSLTVGLVSILSAQNAKTTNPDLVRAILISSLVSLALCSKDHVSISSSQALTSLILHFPPYISALLCSIFVPSLPAALATQPEDGAIIPGPIAKSLSGQTSHRGSVTSNKGVGAEWGDNTQLTTSGNLPSLQPIETQTGGAQTQQQPFIGYGPGSPPFAVVVTRSGFNRSSTITTNDKKVYRARFFCPPAPVILRLFPVNCKRSFLDVISAVLRSPAQALQQTIPALPNATSKDETGKQTEIVISPQVSSSASAETNRNAIVTSLIADALPRTLYDAIEYLALFAEDALAERAAGTKHLWRRREDQGAKGLTNTGFTNTAISGATGATDFNASAIDREFRPSQANTPKPQGVIQVAGTPNAQGPQYQSEYGPALTESQLQGVVGPNGQVNSGNKDVPWWAGWLNQSQIPNQVPCRFCLPLIAEKDREIEHLKHEIEILRLKVPRYPVPSNFALIPSKPSAAKVEELTGTALKNGNLTFVVQPGITSILEENDEATKKDYLRGSVWRLEVVSKSSQRFHKIGLIDGTYTPSAQYAPGHGKESVVFDADGYVQVNGECFSGSGRWSDNDKVAVEVDMRNNDEVKLDGPTEVKEGEPTSEDGRTVRFYVNDKPQAIYVSRVPRQVKFFGHVWYKNSDFQVVSFKESVGDKAADDDKVEYRRVEWKY